MMIVFASDRGKVEAVQAHEGEEPAAESFVGFRYDRAVFVPDELGLILSDWVDTHGDSDATAAGVACDWFDENWPSLLAGRRPQGRRDLDVIYQFMIGCFARNGYNRMGDFKPRLRREIGEPLPRELPKAKKIVNVRCRAVKIMDDHPDLSYLGEYTSKTPGPEDGFVDRKLIGDMDNGEHRYFIGANKEYVEEDYQRMEEYNRGYWHMIAVAAEVRWRVDGTTKSEMTTSSYLFGIESDSGDDYIRQVAQEQFDEIAGNLLEAGFTPGQLKYHRARITVPD